MSIHVLDKQTIDLIAAGEVVERPSSVVKELVENAMDAGATSISVEIKNGGIDFIRVTDNGCGIPKADIQTAFLRHATSKIQTADDLSHIESMGFRGEALSSIAAVTQLEVISKESKELTAADFEIHGGEPVKTSEIGAPNGTTFLVRNIFYNTPARRKFLKSPMTEGSYIGDLMEKFALSHPFISFRFIKNGQTVLATNGNGKVKDLIYGIYGREAAQSLLEVSYESEGIRIEGFIGKPVLQKGNRGFENYYVNGRYVKSKVIDKAIEDGAAPFMMQHRYPFTVLYIELPAEEFDVNVHPTKMELKFSKEQNVYEAVLHSITEAFREKDLIQKVQVEEEKPPKKEEPIYPAIEPFEVKRIQEVSRYQSREAVEDKEVEAEKPKPELKPEFKQEIKAGSKLEPKPVQQELFQDKFLSTEGQKKHRLIGQVFETYWLIEYEKELYIMDQHAAHEKVLFERKMKALQEKTVVSQMVSPPIMISLSQKEELVLNRYMDAFAEIGFEIQSFGGREYAISQVPDDLLNISNQDFFTEMLADLEEDFSERNSKLILAKVASMSCKAAVKGNHLLSFQEADTLIKELLTLENPYACPHGRPTIIRISETELEKKFKRIV